MGLYRKRGSKMWWMTFTVAGHQCWESTRTPNRRLAEKFLNIRLAEIAEGRFGLVPRVTPLLEDWAKQFLETIRHENTRRSYASNVQALLNFFGEVQLSQITVARIEEFKLSRTRAGIGPATINRSLARLCQMLKLAYRRRLIAKSPFEEVDFLEERSRRRQPHILTFEQQEKLLAVASPRIRALVVLLTETGLRIGREALPLKWQHVDLEKGVIRVAESKTLAGRRLIPLSELCKAELLRWKNLLGPDFSPYVFPQMENTRHPLQGGRKAWASTLKKADVPYFPIYNLRATFASRLSAAGVPDTFVAQMMGHSTTSILHTYAKAIDEYRCDAIRKLESLRQAHAGLETRAPLPARAKPS